MLTACGIETLNNLSANSPISESCNSAYRLRYWNPCPFATTIVRTAMLQQCLPLAVLKLNVSNDNLASFCKLQQCLPLAVLKQSADPVGLLHFSTLQQCLPLAVLKPNILNPISLYGLLSCNSAYRLRYWNMMNAIVQHFVIHKRCNSAYRLRYWN